MFRVTGHNDCVKVIRKRIKKRMVVKESNRKQEAHGPHRSPEIPFPSNKDALLKTLR